MSAILRALPLDRDELRPVLGAFATLAAIMAGHTLLETARDALFLAKLPATHLPWVYLAVAALAVTVTRLEQRVLSRFGGAWLLSVSLALAAAVNLGLWHLAASGAPWVLYALYVWTGLCATVLAVFFWLLVAGAWTVTQAKRLYGLIGAGSVGGALAGSLLSRWLAHAAPARHLLVAAAALFAVAAALPVVALAPRRGPEEPVRRRHVPLREDLPLLRDDPYLRRIAGLVVISTITFTFVDYLFKSVVAARVPAERLGEFFATVSVALNLVSLVAQLGLVAWIVRRFGTTRALWVTPVLLLGGGAAVALGGGLVAVAVLKGADGGLRYSLHRTAMELLYVPISDGVRRRIKGLVDAVGQRGGQAIASIAILLIGALGAGAGGAAAEAVLGGAVIALSVAWIAIAAGVKRHYLDLFRKTLQRGAVETRIELPALDMRALEFFLVALNSRDDAEVLAALDLLAAQGRVRLIPALIVFHPSRDVVLRALELFVGAGRTDFVAPADRLLGHRDPEVRAAALVARCAVQPDRTLLLGGLDDRSPIVRAAALVYLVSMRWIDEDEAGARLRAVARSGAPEERIALARAIRRRPDAAFRGVLLALADTDDAAVALEVAQAMGELRSPAFVPALVRMLGSRAALHAARAALFAIGPPALAELERALSDRSLPHRVRLHLPRTISRFDPGLAMPILLSHLATETDGMVSYKILRGLGRLRAEAPHVALDIAILARAIKATIEDVFRAIDWRLSLERGRGADAAPLPASPSRELLTALLHNKESLGIERLFRLLGLLHPKEDFERIYRGVTSERPALRASSRELLEHLIAPPMRGAVIALIDEVPDEQRLAHAAPLYEAARLPYDALLEVLLAAPSESLRCLAAYHVGEIGHVALRACLEALEVPASSPFKRVVERALKLLAEREQEALRRAG